MKRCLKCIHCVVKYTPETNSLDINCGVYPEIFKKIKYNTCDVLANRFIYDSSDEKLNLYTEYHKKKFEQLGQIINNKEL